MQSPSSPLANARHEAFALAVARGAKLGEAYIAAGFTCKVENSRNRGYALRHRPDVDARVTALLEGRVQADTRSFLRRKKGSGDLLARVVKELEDIAFQDVRELVDWRREAVTNAAGEVVDVRETVQIRDSAKLTPAAAKAVKSVFLKGDRIRLDLHDKRAALETLAKILKGDDVAAAPSVAITQNNFGTMSAVDAAQRVAFLLASVAQRAAAQPLTIDVTPAATQE